jgi:hypothetical protein
LDVSVIKLFLSVQNLVYSLLILKPEFFPDQYLCHEADMLRSRAKRVSKTVKELDAFPKVPESYVETSPVGGTCMHLAVDTFIIKTCIVIS